MRENGKNMITLGTGFLIFSEEIVVGACLFATVLLGHCYVFAKVLWVVARLLLTC